MLGLSLYAIEIADGAAPTKFASNARAARRLPDSLRARVHDRNDSAAPTSVQAGPAETDPGGKLVLFENIIDDGAPDPARVVDIIMLSVTGGKERTSPQIRRLLAAGGFHLDDITPLPTGLNAITATAT